MSKDYQTSIDVLKGIAILAVVLYHVGVIKTGYLGVDVFLVINGFLILPGILQKMESGDFSAGKFMVRRIMRLLPLLVIASLVCLLIGYMGMLPDDYENLSQSVVAGLVFSNNLLAAITTKDYWNIVNEYKPLMHTWYLGILMEFYVILVIVACLSKWIAARLKRVSATTLLQGILAVCTTASLILYFIPSIDEGMKFYLIPFRMFELVLGGFVGIYAGRLRQNKLLGNRWFSVGTLCLLLVIVFSSVFSGAGYGTQIIPIGAPQVEEKISFLPGNVLLPMTVIVSCLILCGGDCLLKGKILACLGKRSYSMFLWHQIIVAFYRYFMAKNLSGLAILLYVVLVLLLSEGGYRFVEKITITRKSIWITVASTAVLMLAAFGIYLRAGVVRDIPELDISAEEVYRGMHAEYVERIYAYDMAFPEENDKINVLVVGNSFARDWANILLESDLAESINLSYSFAYSGSEEFVKRVENSDYIFSFSAKEEVPQYVWEHLQADAKIWGIGTKNFGECNGIIYAKRFRTDYYEQTISLDAGYEELNEQWKESWGEAYIDLIECVKTEDGRIRVFSPEGKLLSQDCEHLTRGGARYYAEIIDFDRIFNVE